MEISNIKNQIAETLKHRKISFNGGDVAARIVKMVGVVAARIGVVFGSRTTPKPLPIRAATPTPIPFCDSRALRASVVCIISLCTLFAPLLSYALPQDNGIFKVYVWGEVKNPGIYRLSGTPDIVELLSSAGGPTQKADLTRLTLVRSVSQEKTRINLKRDILQGKMVFLVPGDVILVPTSFFSKLKDNLPVIGTLAIFANLTISVIQATK